MAKNESLPTVSYMRKDTNFLVDGTWYVSTPCPTHGLVDEEVSWNDAKTPHHAGVIADKRHEACHAKLAEEEMRAFGLAEIEAARDLLAQQRVNLENARLAYVAARAAAKDDRASQLALEDAGRALDKHTEGLDHALRRLEDVRRHNS